MATMPQVEVTEEPEQLVPESSLEQELDRLSHRERELVRRIVHKASVRGDERIPLDRISMLHTLANDGLEEAPSDAGPEGAPKGHDGDNRHSEYSLFNPPNVIASNHSETYFDLPSELSLLGHSMAETVLTRRSKRLFSLDPMSMLELGTLFQAAYGVRGASMAYNRKSFPLRNAPTSGGLQSVEVYAAVNSVPGVIPGVYHYYAHGNRLESVTLGKVKRRIVRLCGSQEWIGCASAVLVFVCDTSKLEWKYGHRGYLMSHVDAGAVCQSFHTVATAMGLSSCFVAGIDSRGLGRLLEIDEESQFVVLTLPVGKAIHSNRPWAQLA